MKMLTKPKSPKSPRSSPGTLHYSSRLWVYILSIASSATHSHACVGSSYRPSGHSILHCISEKQVHASWLNTWVPSSKIWSHSSWLYTLWMTWPSSVKPMFSNMRNSVAIAAQKRIVCAKVLILILKLNRSDSTAFLRWNQCNFGLIGRLNRYNELCITKILFKTQL